MRDARRCVVTTDLWNLSRATTCVKDISVKDDCAVYSLG